MTLSLTDNFATSTFTAQDGAAFPNPTTPLPPVVSLQTHTPKPLEESTGTPNGNGPSAVTTPDDRRTWIADSLRVSGLSTWSGPITELFGDEFTAELTSGQSGDTYFADFDMAQLGQDDEPVVGDLVYVTVRQVLDPNGRPLTTSSIRLRRLGRWTEADISAHHEKAKDLKQILDSLAG